MTPKPILALPLLLALTACVSAPRDKGPAAPTAVARLGDPAGAHYGFAAEYRIGPLDVLNITVFQVKDLTMEKVQVDASGRILLPLIGLVEAGGKTTAELSAEIGAKLQEKYLQSPQVSVLVAEAASQKVTVDGAVKEAGVYVLKGRTTLLQAVAMAKGPDRAADLKHVVVFRQLDGRRNAAIFDLQAIRKGQSDDPEIQGDDVIVVDTSRGKAIWRDIVATLPAFSILNVFRPL